MWQGFLTGLGITLGIFVATTIIQSLTEEPMKEAKEEE